MPPSPVRLVALATSAALAMALLGFGWELARYGLGRSSEGRIQAGVRGEFDGRARAVETLAEAAAQQSALIERAYDPDPDRDGLPTLFASLADLSSRLGAGTMSVTIYSAAGPRGPHEILAWSDGPAQDPPGDRLDGPASLFFQQTAIGLLLVSVRPVDAGGRRIATAVAESVFSPILPTRAPASYPDGDDVRAGLARPSRGRP